MARSATRADIKKAFFKLSLLVHPDRNKIAADVDMFRNAFQRLNDAQSKLNETARGTPIPGFRPKS